MFEVIHYNVRKLTGFSCSPASFDVHESLGNVLRKYAGDRGVSEAGCYHDHIRDYYSNEVLFGIPFSVKWKHCVPQWLMFSENTFGWP